MTIQRAIFSLLVLLLPASLQSQIILSVSPKGNDRNIGTMQAPFKTLSKAFAYAVTLTGREVQVQVREGTYYLDTTLVLKAEAVKCASLLVSAWDGEKVTVSAGRRLLLKWKPYREGVYQAAVPAGVYFERLYVNGVLQTLARYPNYDSTARVFHGTAADAISPERVTRWKNPVGGYVHALHVSEWGGFHYRITGVDRQGRLSLEGGWQNNRPNAMHKEYRFVENVFEELDTAGEWYLDKAKRVLYYHPAKGMLPPVWVEVSHLKNSIVLQGTADRPVHDIRLHGLQFAHNERSFMDTREPLLRSDWTIYRGGAVLMEGTENCLIAGCFFSGLGGNAVMFSNYNKKDTVSGCLVQQIGANAVCFVGDTKAVRSPAFRYEAYVPYAQMDKTPGPLTRNYPQACVVTNNLMHHLGEVEKQATGVEIDIASAITVSHNTIYHTPRAGINIGDGCFGGHVLEYNDVFHTVLETGDHGAFNSWGRDRYWAPGREYMDSLVAAHPELILLDAQQPVLIRNNRFRCDHGWDIDLDDGSSNYRIYNNVCLNGGLKLREGFYRIVENNILVNNSFHPHVWFNNSGDAFQHNIVMKKYFPIRINQWGNAVDSNLFPDESALKAAQANGTDAHSQAGYPLFVNTAAGDYTVAAHSPALAVGFRNFSMTDFGVQNAALKKQALQPAIPALMQGQQLEDKSTLFPFLGGQIKSVDGLGERSAYGLPNENGVIIVATGTNSLLFKSGLKEKDVILKADETQVNDVKSLLDIYQSAVWKGKIDIEVMRNQQPVKLVLQLK